jgi:LacI family transcriptional regulator
MPTIKDVAERAGVSAMTVSRVLNNMDNVRPSTRERVQRAIEDLGYVPSGVAKSLRSKRTRTLALLVPDGANAFWTTVARGVEDAAQNGGYSVLFCNTDEDVAKQLHYLDVIVGQQVDGVIIAPCDSDAHNLSKLRQRGIPTVLVDRYIKGWDVDTIIGDSISGARALVRHLIGLDHRRIAVLSGPATTSTASDRIAGYRIALAESGIPYEPRLVKEGEYHATSGERLTHQLLDEGLDPTAIFAANNAIMIGAIDALGKRGLHVPQDMAMVCFDDLPNTSHFFPFLTVASLPSYEMGVYAAQLLLGRLEADVDPSPRYVILPARLKIRHSCGSRLGDVADDAFCLSVPISREGEVQSLVQPLSPEEVKLFSDHLTGIPDEVLQIDQQPSAYGKSDVDRLLAVLQHREADRVPYLGLGIASKAVYESILERELAGDGGDAGTGRPNVAPEDQVELALRLGLDAVVCRLSWRPDGELNRTDGWVKAWSDLEKLEPPLSLAGQLDYLERYLRAAQGTGVGVAISFPSFFANAMRSLGAPTLDLYRHNRPFLEAAMDMLLDYWVRVAWAVCDRFANDLAFVMVNDDLGQALEDPELFLDIYAQRMQRLIAPAKQHGKLVALRVRGWAETLLPVAYDLGFDIVFPAQLDLDDAFGIREQWAGRLALIGSLPAALLGHGDRDEIEWQVRELCGRLASGGGYVLAASMDTPETILPENLLAMARAVHRFGRFGSLGEEGQT